jgi:uncharacterized membrane protein
MAYFLKLYTAILVAFFAIDMLWLGLVARTFYRKHLGYIMAPSPNWAAAIIFYLLFLVGLMIFVVLPGLEAGSLTTTLLRGALYGLITYATYDLTNQATIKDWPVVVTVVDMFWGVFLSVAVSTIGFFAGRWLA